MANARLRDFKQYDPRWGKKMYSKNNHKLTIRNNGCGVAAAADLVASLWDPDMTPAKMADIAIRHGFCAEGSGTYRSFFQYLANIYHAQRFFRTTDTNAVKAALEQGGYAIALMGKGYWTKGGHYIALWWYKRTNNLFYANDPASRLRKSDTGTHFQQQRKEYFVFFK